MRASAALGSQSWRIAGREIARTLAKQNQGKAPAQLDTIIEWYENYSGKDLPVRLRQQLEFAQTRPDIFNPLLRDNIFPLDAYQSRSKMNTVVDCAREMIKSFETDYCGGALDPKVVLLQMGYVLKRGESTVRIRELSNFCDLVAKFQPDLLPFVRPDTTAEARCDASYHKKVWLEELESILQRNYKPRRNYFVKPGLITSVTRPNLSITDSLELYRLSWVKFDAVEQVVDHMLQGLERCSLSFRNPELSLHNIARMVRTTDQWITDVFEEGGNPRKLYVGASRLKLRTFSGHPSESRGLENSRFVRWGIDTKRAFPISDNPNSLHPVGEAEWGIPVLINPREFRSAEWFSKNGPVSIYLNWSEDNRSVEVEVEVVSGIIDTYSLIYDFKSPSLGYQKRI